jgi:hypothetical protein
VTFAPTCTVYKNFRFQCIKDCKMLYSLGSTPMHLLQPRFPLRTSATNYLKRFCLVALDTPGSRTMFHICTADSATSHSDHVHILYIITPRDTLTSKRATASLNSSPGHEVDPCGKLLLHNASYHFVLFCSPSHRHSSLSLSLSLSLCLPSPLLSLGLLHLWS